MQLDGQIIKGIGGFYYVETTKGIFECKAKGKFRKDKISPLTGDRVTITVRKDKENTIDEISERKNKLIRPPVANIDKLMIVVSAAKPVPNYLIIDKMTVLAEKSNIEPIVIITKTDLADCTELYETYRSTGYKVFLYSDVADRSMLDAIKSELNGYLTAFTGNSGVGKSTLINALSDSLKLETAEISDKLGRGRHTTRQAEIFHINGGLVIDTAGFSSIDFSNDNAIFSDELECYFNEFSDYIGECKFTGCTHLGEKGCKICELVEKGILSRNRYNSYLALYNEQKSLKRWNL